MSSTTLFGFFFWKSPMLVLAAFAATGYDKRTNWFNLKILEKSNQILFRQHCTGFFSLCNVVWSLLDKTLHRVFPLQWAIPEKKMGG